MQAFRAASLRDRPPVVERGVSLIELMVGLALGVVVTFALVTLFDNNSRARRHVDQATQQIENGRYALDLLREDLHLAGYYGGAVPWQGISLAAAAGTRANVCATTVAALLFSTAQWPVPVFGIAAGDTVPACVSGATGGHKAGTDILVVRRTKTIPTAIGSLVGASIYVQASGCNAELQQLHTKDLVVGLGSGGAGAFVLHKRDCVNTAEVFEFQTRIYYISNETVPTLRLLTLSGATSTNEPLVEGIEDMRFEYGRDTNNDGAANGFRKCLAAIRPRDTNARP
jgi:type IV pilus assembly protein PilW